MKMNSSRVLAAFAALCGLSSVAQQKEPSVMLHPPHPQPVFRVSGLRADERPVQIETVREVVSENALYQRVSTTLTFTNPNARVFEGELEFPLPEGATVCGYALETNGEMVPGVVVPKETARVAFENEKRRGVDPGLVEHVKGNVWKTRIYPLQPKTPRKARVDYLVESVAAAKSGTVLAERRDGVVYVARLLPETARNTRAERLRKATRARLYWDASFSRDGRVAADRALLECLPETGDWELVVYRNVVEAPVAFTSRAELLKAVDALVYDGDTCPDPLAAERMPAGRASGREAFLFTDEIDPDAACARRVSVEKLTAGEKPPVEPTDGDLLATAWAANRVADLSANAEAHRDELVALGRDYGIASSVTSLLVLERLDQYLTYKVEPPKALSFHDEWVRRRAAEDDPIADEKAKAEHRGDLLRYWEERVKWWKDPVPPKQTPKSGLFDRVRNLVTGSAAPAVAGESVVVRSMAFGAAAMAEDGAMEVSSDAAAPSRSNRRFGSTAASRAPVAAKCGAPEVESAGASATVTLAAWDPKTPYLDALKAAEKGAAYGEYLRQRATYGNSPAFFLDVAGWFFKAGEAALAKRIVSNLVEMKLEDPALWRTMGWRLREAGAYEEAIAAFRHVLEMRGEEPQSKRDLALVLMELGKERKDVALLSEAARLYHAAAFERTARRSGRRGNDMQTSVVALEELNGLLSWCAANGLAPEAPALESAFRRDLPVDLRIVLSWDADETDIDLHVLEPDGEEAFYGHRRTSTGGFVSEDVTTGYGPEEYLRKTASKGVYKVLSNYFASHQQALTGAAVVTATVYTHWSAKNETRQILSLRLDKPKDKHLIGEVTFGGETEK